MCAHGGEKSARLRNEALELRLRFVEPRNHLIAFSDLRLPIRDVQLTDLHAKLCFRALVRQPLRIDLELGQPRRQRLEVFLDRRSPL